MILEPLTRAELEYIFDETALKVLKYYMKKAVMLQPEILTGQTPLPIQVPKEHIEQWVLQAIGGHPTGAGSYPVDLVKPNDFGADIKMLSCKLTKDGYLADSDSGETSLAQKFTDSGADLDDLFITESYQDIVNSWKTILYNKLSRVYSDFNLNNIYYIFILRAGTTFHLCATKVNINEIDDMTVLRNTSSSVYVNNLIDPIFGNGKIYKAKKRLELRLRPRAWVNRGYTMSFDLNFVPPSVDVRELIENNILIEHKRVLCDYFLEED